MCQFHMVAIIRRKLTKNPQLEAGKELLGNELTQEKEAAEQQLEEKMERWMYLEDLAARIERGEEN